MNERAPLSAVKLPARLIAMGLLMVVLAPTLVYSQPAPPKKAIPYHTQVKPTPKPSAFPPVEVIDPAHPPGVGRPGEAGSFTLESSVKQGLDKNPSIKVADERVATAVAQYHQASSAKNLQLVFNDTTIVRPKVSINSTEGLLGNQQVASFPSTFTLLDQVHSQINMSLQLLLTSFGKVENQIAASYLNIDSQAKSTDVDRRNLDLQVKQSFLQHLKTLAAREAARANLEVSEQSLHDTNALFHQGILAKFDVVQAELQVVEATQSLAQRDTSIKTTAASFRSILLLPADAPLLLVPPDPIVIDPDVDVKSLQALALIHRPELISLNRQMDVAKALLSAAHSESNPTVSMNLTYLTNPGNNLAASNLVYMGFNFSWYLFDGGLRDGKVGEAESQIRSIEYQGDQLRLQVLLDAENSWLNYQQTYYDLVTAQKRVETAGVYYDMARQRFVYGLGTSLETQNALKALNDARLNEVVAYYNRDLAFAQIEQSIGMDFFNRHLIAAQPAPGPAQQGETDEH